MHTEKKELFTKKVSAGKRTYFFDVKESVEGAKYLVISESRQAGEKFEHNRVMVFEEDIFSFHNGLKEALKFIFDSSLK